MSVVTTEVSGQLVMAKSEQVIVQMIEIRKQCVDHEMEIIQYIKGRYLIACDERNDLAGCAARANQIMAIARRAGSNVPENVRVACVDMLQQYEDRRRYAEELAHIILAMKQLILERPW